MADTSEKSNIFPPVPDKAKVLLEGYFTQITRGCGDGSCTIANCASNANRIERSDCQDSNGAAALALNLFRKRAPLCPSLSPKNIEITPTSNQSMNQISNVDDAVDSKSIMEVDSAEDSTVKTLDYLTEARLVELINECEAKNDHTILRRVLGQIFYNTEAVKKSFRLTSNECEDGNKVSIGFPRTPAPVKATSSSRDVDDDDDHYTNGISVDLNQVRSAFRILFNIPVPSFQQTLINAIKYLMENAEVELRYRRAYEESVEYLNIFVIILEMPLLHEPEFIQQAFPAFCKAAAQLPVDGQAKLARFLSSYSNMHLLNIIHAVQQSITVHLLSGNYGRHHSVQEDECVTSATKLLRILYYAALLGGDRDSEEHLAAEKEFYANEDAALHNLLRQDEFRAGENEEQASDGVGGTSKEIPESKTDPLGKLLAIRPIDVRRPITSFEEFYNETLSEIIDIYVDFVNYKAEDGRFSFMDFPFILLPATKMKNLFFDSRIRMHAERRQAMFRTLMGENSSPYLRLRVRRAHLVQDSLAMLEIIAMESPGDFKKQLYVEFENEQGVDEGGVSKEFYQLITAQLFNPDYGMFTYRPESRLYWFNPRGLDSGPEYTLIGTMFGLAIYNNVIVDVQFPMVVYKKLSGKLGTLDDLKDVDPVLHSSLTHMLQYDGDDFEDVFQSTFCITYTDCFGEPSTFELKLGGNEIPVTKDNRKEFVALYADYLLNRSVEQQFHAFRRGFCMVCTSESLLSWLFRPDEIEQLVCGSKHFDFQELEQSTHYDNGYTDDHQTIKYFWEIIHEMSEEQKRLFLRFVTGSDRIPIGGMSKLNFTVARNGPDSEKLPTAHTCFNVLLLPDYGVKEKLKERLLKAIAYCEGFGLITSDEGTDGEAINEFNKLRNKACVQPLDRHESSLEILYKYYDQLVAIEGKLPLTPTQIPVPFKWKDAFEKGLFGRGSLTLSSGGYEKACVMYNIAALQSQVAAAQRCDTDDELKLVAKLYQQAAGILSYLKDYVLSMVQQDPTADLMPDTLAALSALCLAQAQEAIYLKAARDQMKPAIIAKIAAQAAELYAEAVRQLGRDILRSLWERDWMPIVNGKHLAFQALAHYQQSIVAKEGKEIGEELSRLQHANQLMQQAQQQFANGHVQSFKNETAAIQKAHDLAKKDNDFIYHERIPDVKQLPAIGKAALAKSLPVANPMSPRFKDLFEKLVPVAVHQALARYDARKGDIVNMEVGRLREHTQLMNAALASLNLPAAVEDVCNEQELPESIREKSAKVKTLGGIQAIQRMIGELPGLLKRNQEIIDETVRILTEERGSDDQLRQQFGARWTRMQSEKLTEPLWQEIGKYKQILETAASADNIVKQKYEANRQGFELLSKPEPDLRKTIPHLVHEGGNKNSVAINKLKQLMQVVEEIKKDRERLEKELKDASFDMTSTFLKAMAESGAFNDDQISVAKLNDIYGPIREEISNSIKRQENVMNEVQVANTQFTQERGSSSGAAEREKVLKQLVTGYDSYLELVENLKEGTKFYNDLTPLLLRLQQKVSDFNFARKTEKEDLMKDLQQNIVNQPTTIPPQNPQYQGGTTTASNKPPPRPPPPQFTSASASPSTTTSSALTSAPQAPYAAPLSHNAYPGASASNAQPQAPPYQYSSYPYPSQPNYYATYPPPMQHPQAPYPTGIPPYPQPGPYQSGYPPAPAGYNPYAPIQQPPQGAPQWH